jgi:hypothetical protein
MKLSTGLILGFLLLIGSAVSLLASGVFAVPVSEKVVVTQIDLPNGGRADVAIRDGSMIVVRNEEQGKMYGFVPKLSPTVASSLDMKVFEITDEPKGQAADEVLSSAVSDSRIGTEHKIELENLVCQVRFRGVRNGKFPPVTVIKNPHDLPTDALEHLFGTSSGSSCCLTCSGFTVCGARVSMGCGVCTADFMME